MKICCIFNIAPAYRLAIFRQMDTHLDVDFYFGDDSHEGIALLDPTQLEGFCGYLGNRFRGRKLIWQRRAIGAAFGARYDAYILTGNEGILSNWIITLLARVRGQRVVLWTHGLSGKESWFKRCKNMLYMRLAGHLMCYGERAKALLIERGYDARKIAVIYNSLDYDNQHRILERMGDATFLRNYFGNSLPYVAFVGRLTRTKRIDMILQACARLDCNIVIIGDGPQRTELERLTEELDMQDRVWFYGATLDEQVMGTILYHAHATVSPGNVGLTAIHSLTFGTRVVTHSNLTEQMPEVEALVEGTSGEFFEQNSVESLQLAIAKVLAVTPEQREQIRSTCREIIDSKFNPHSQIKIMVQYLSIICNKEK